MHGVLVLLPEPLKKLMLTFKTVANTTFSNPGDKKGVNGVRIVLESISKQ